MNSCIIPASHLCVAIKAAKELKLPEWKDYIKNIAFSIPEVWAKNKLECGRIETLVWIEGSDPRPERQYKFPREAEESIQETMCALVKQEVLIEVHSIVNSPTWPVRKADGTIWSLTVDYQQLNKNTPALAPVVAKYSEVLSSIAGGAQ